MATEWEKRVHSRATAGYVSFLVVVLAFAGCGSTKKAATTTREPAALARAAAEERGKPPIKTVAYHVRLLSANRPAGAPPGSGLAVISVNASSDELCYEFSQLKNVTVPVKARIEGQLQGAYEVASLGRKYQASGCTSRPAGFLRTIETEPRRFSIVIYEANAQLPVVRGRL